MTNSILEEIYYSNCGQAEKLKAGEEYWRLEKEAGEYYDKLYAVLNEEQREWLYQFWFLSAGSESKWGYENFCAGLKFGMRLISEINNDKNTSPD